MPTGISSIKFSERLNCRNLKFGYFTQHFVDQLDMDVCGVEIMQKEFPGRFCNRHYYLCKNLPLKFIPSGFYYDDCYKFRFSVMHFCAGKKVEEYRRMLGQFGVTGDMALQQIGNDFFPQNSPSKMLSLFRTYVNVIFVLF
jgi:ATP-binding cassette subfamily F protein 3